MKIYEFTDLKCRAWFEDRGNKSPLLVVEDLDGKLIGKILADRIVDGQLYSLTDGDSIRVAVLRVTMAAEELQKIKEGICPACGDMLFDARIQSGKYKGHGVLVCQQCRWRVMI